jgi:hypothetical protein
LIQIPYPKAAPYPAFGHLSPGGGKEKQGILSADFELILA